MQKLLKIDPKQYNLAIISNDKNLFFEDLKLKIRSLSSDEFYDWIVNDINMCYLLLWLHPVTSIRLFGTQSKVINMTSRHDYEKAIRDFKRYWPDHTRLISVMFERFEFILRIESDNLFSRHRSKYEKDMYSHTYLKLKLPFQFMQNIICNYNVKLNKNDDVRRVIYTDPWISKPTPITDDNIHPTAHRLAQINSNKLMASVSEIHRNGFIPYGLCMVYDELKSIIPFELFRLCVLYYVRIDDWERRRNIENRIL